MLDGYPAQSVLESELQFDNSAFIETLKDKGFLIAADAPTPYNRTLPIMGTVYSGTYLDPDVAPLDDTYRDRMRVSLGRIIFEGSLKEQLISLGYSFLYTESGYITFQPAERDGLARPYNSDTSPPLDNIRILYVWGQSKNQQIQTEFVYVDARYSGILGGDPVASSTENLSAEEKA